jgi:hypothetical protein
MVPALRFTGDGLRVLDGARIRNVLEEAGGDLRRSAAALVELLRMSGSPG